MQMPLLVVSTRSDLLAIFVAQLTVIRFQGLLNRPAISMFIIHQSHYYYYYCYWFY
jgi:hypothetical protein